jgi:Cu/Ag efflux protein CusF
MRVLTLLGFVVCFALVLVVGCSQKPMEKSAAQSYDIKGRIVAIRPDKTGVTLDHEDIPGLMKGMKMEFPVQDAKLLEGLEVGDQVQGKLQVESGKQIITELKKL